MKAKMRMKRKIRMIRIPEHEYKRLKKIEKIDFDLVRQFASSLADLKAGRFKRIA